MFPKTLLSYKKNTSITKIEQDDNYSFLAIYITSGVLAQVKSKYPVAVKGRRIDISTQLILHCSLLQKS